MKWFWPATLAGRVALLLAAALIGIQLITLPYFLRQRANVVAVDSELLSLELRDRPPPDSHGDDHAELARRLSGQLQRQVAVAHQGDKTEVWVALERGSWLRLALDTRTPSAGWVVHMTAQILLAVLVLVVVSVLAARQITRSVRLFVSAAERLGVDVNSPPMPEEGSKELRQAARVFNTMQRRLQDYVNDRTRMLAAISHDLRTLLTRLRLRLEYIEDPEQRGRALADLEQMDAMLASTLSFARDDANQEQPVRVDLAKLLYTLVDDFTDLGHEVIYRGPESLTVVARPLALQRAIGNVLDNAVCYGGRAYLSLDSSAGQCRIFVEDDGPGLDNEQLEAMFEPFVRGDPARNRGTGGTGLGLSIARSVMRSHGGDVLLANRPEGGLRVELTLAAPFAA